MSETKDVVGEVVHDLTNPETGRTYREDNLQRQHKIPIGALVEIRHDPPELEDGFRLHVVQHRRDCDGEPLYSLGLWTENEETRGHACLTALDDDGYPPKFIWQGCGYGEESLRLVGGPVDPLDPPFTPLLEEATTYVPQEWRSAQENVEAAVSRGIVEAFKILMPLLVSSPKSYIVQSRLSEESREELSRILDEITDPQPYLQSFPVLLAVNPDYASMWSDLKAAIDSAEYPVMQELVKIIEK